jgi:dolichol-phosphate mannosyltransferase
MAMDVTAQIRSAAAKHVRVAAKPAPELSVILPTFNERHNLPILVERIARALTGRDWEIVIVDDDSPDGTGAAARRLAEQDRRIRCIRRIGRRGLAGACLEGMLSSQARYLAVMDADLQHDEELLATMLARLQGGDVDLVVGSRYCEGGSASSFTTSRARTSRWSSLLARRLLKVELTDPMSGFFMLRREVIDDLAPSLSPQGFKILLDIAASARERLRVVELPYVFNERRHGESKLDARVALDFVQLLVAKLSDNAVSFRFVVFCFVDLTGVGVHMAVLALLHAVFQESFSVGQSIATAVAIGWNFIFNNALTYRDQRLVGRQFVGGLLRFEVICAVGAVSNIGIASLIYGNDGNWWVAGLGGAIMGAVWNYAVSAAFVWRSR